MFRFELRLVKVLSLVMVLLGHVPWSLAQPIVTNAQTGLTHASIGEAISAAVRGNTLYIEEADWPESLHIDKDLTLIGMGNGFRLTPPPSSQADLVVINIKYQKTVTIKNMEVSFLNESNGYMPNQYPSGNAMGVRSVITNNGWLRLENVYLESNRTLKGVIVNKGFAELYTDNVKIWRNREMNSFDPGGGIKNHGLFEAFDSELWWNAGNFGGIYNASGDALLIDSKIDNNLGDYGAFENTVDGVVLGFSTRVWDNAGSICSDFRDPNRGGCSNGVWNFWL